MKVHTSSENAQIQMSLLENNDKDLYGNSERKDLQLKHSAKHTFKKGTFSGAFFELCIVKP